MISHMRPEPLLHLRAAIKRGCHPDYRDLRWLAQNLNYLDSLETDVKTTAQYWLDEENKSLLLPPVTRSGSNHNPAEEAYWH
ncbi:hypothetical protein Lepto7375DRAFT_0699 [Leptolyngbya sp. PCC 7375]|nr:hypothetical protein Lepto7375DRAFT_0699 [Leptolyngbya sp. PCC 7375]